VEPIKAKIESGTEPQSIMFWCEQLLPLRVVVILLRNVTVSFLPHEFSGRTYATRGETPMKARAAKVFLGMGVLMLLRLFSQPAGAQVADATLSGAVTRDGRQGPRKSGKGSWPFAMRHCS
jgi:hypothetical protein